VTTTLADSCTRKYLVLARARMSQLRWRPMASTRLDELELRAWQALLHAHHDVVGALDEELRARHAITFSEYDVLLRLARAPERALSMGELAERTMLSPSGTTRLVDRLTASGLVRRRRQPDDGRVALATLTPEGLRRVRAAARTHLRGIRQHFTGRLSRRQLQQIASGLETIAGQHVPH
jgi:DNA-binding MarR family transcriptional regulator